MSKVIGPIGIILNRPSFKAMLLESQNSDGVTALFDYLALRAKMHGDEALLVGDTDFAKGKYRATTEMISDLKHLLSDTES